MRKELQKVLDFIKLSKQEEQVEEQVVQLAEEKLINGSVLVSEDFQEGKAVFIKSEDEESDNVPVPVGTYELEGGRVLVVEVEGEIASIGDKPSEDDNDAVESDNEVEETEEVTETYEEPAGESNGLEKENAELKAKIKELQDEIAKIKGEQKMNAEQAPEIEKAVELESQEEVKEGEVKEVQKVQDEAGEEKKFAPEHKEPVKMTAIAKRQQGTSKSKVFAKFARLKK